MNVMQKNKQGYALITVMGIMAVLSVSFAMLHSISQQSAHTTKRLRDKALAVTYAEAGIEYAYSVIDLNFSSKDNVDAFLRDADSEKVGLSAKNDYGEGSFTISLRNPMGTAQYVLVNSKGTCRNEEVDIEVLIEDGLFGDPIETTTNQPTAHGDLENNVMVSTGDMTFRGTADVIAGSGDYFNIITTGTIDINGSITIEGNLVGGTVNLDKDVAGDVTGNTVNVKKNQGSAKSVDETKDTITVDFPTYEFDLFLKYAAANDALVVNESGTTTLTGNPPSGDVWYIKGDVVIDGPIDATVIAEGNITIANAAELRGQYGFAAATRGEGRDIIMNAAQGTVYGLLYSEQGMVEQRGGDIYGQIAGYSGAYKSGMGLLSYSPSIPSYPPEVSYGSVDNLALVAGWQNYSY